MQYSVILHPCRRCNGVLARILLALVLATTAFVPALPASATPDAPGAATLLDVTISLHSKPDTTEKRAPYERIIQYFADGVYEASNGADKIRTVRIYTGGRYANRADVVWVASCHPTGAVSGRGVQGLHINMCDTFSGLDFLADDNGGQGGGYTLAHEWGHYFYSVYDEYLGAASYDSIFTFPHSTDTPVPNAIMNSQWNARGGDFSWLNFSTAVNHTGRTAQHRVYGASAWETLVRPVTDDPRNGQRTALPQRLIHAELSGSAPGANQSPAIDLPGTGRSDLKIIWVEDLIYQIVIDHSGSMGSEEKMANAKTAAKLLVDLAEVEASIVGVIQFDDVVDVVQPLTPIADQATKNAIKAQIDTIVIGDTTAIGDAAQAALDGLLAYNAPDASPAVYLLTDGQQTAGTLLPADVIPAYAAAGVPLYTFGYGSDADGSTLGEMAAETGGQYYFSPTAFAELSKVFQDANERVSPTVGILAGSLLPQSGAPAVASFPIDDTLGDLSVAVTYPGPQAAVTLGLTGPGGAVAPPPGCSVSTSETLCIFTLDHPATGVWTLTSSTAGAAVAVTYRISGRGNGVFTYSAALNSLGGVAVTYPQPIVLLAILGKEIPIAGAVVAAEMRTPSGTILPVTLRDDGVAPDARAQDGLYSAIVSYAENGVYNFSVQFDNSLGSAALTQASFQPTVGPNGEVMPLPSPTPIAANFARFARAQVTVQGMQSDDHTNSASGATPLSPDNAGKPGRIDYAGDVDFFRVDVAGAGAVVARVANLALGMNPRLRVYSSDGATLRADVDLTTHGNSSGYLSLNLDTASGTVVYLVVSQVGDQAVGGTYDISVGPSLVGDAATSSGGSLYLPAVVRAREVVTLRNGGFEEGPSAGWISTSSGGYPLIVSSATLGFAPYSGDWAVWLGGAPNEISTIDQQVTIVPGQAVLSFYFVIGSNEDVCSNDVGVILVNDTVVETVDLCRSNAAGVWLRRQVNLGAYAGQTVKIGFRATLNADTNSNFFIDAVALGSAVAASAPESASASVLNLPLTHERRQVP